jgi:hypothetical protein
MYHRAEKMKSMGVLQREVELMSHIIEFNKRNKVDYDEFEIKKDMLDNEMQVCGLALTVFRKYRAMWSAVSYPSKIIRK